ncbi:hypothetical protein [Bacillus thuringiensis]|uniref:hypothetical protein n=1 Tax=Bacillus thuringiensis TaxID=1428 RepID=UPI003336FF3C
MQSAATIDDSAQVQPSVSFCSMMQVPQGFVYVPNGTRKIAYGLSNLSIAKETSQKTITVDNCSPVDVTLNFESSRKYPLHNQCTGPRARKSVSSVYRNVNFSECPEVRISKI